LAATALMESKRDADAKLKLNHSARGRLLCRGGGTKSGAHLFQVLRLRSAPHGWQTERGVLSPLLLMR